MSYTAEEMRRLPDRTDWERVHNMTDEEVEAAIASDPDSDIDVDWSKAVWVLPISKQAVSIRLDSDVLTFFRQEGKGYQSRINAVLRHYVEAKSTILDRIKITLAEKDKKRPRPRKRAKT